MARDQRERRREGSRRAQAARQRRMEARDRRKSRNLMFGIGGVAVVAIAIAIFVLLSGGDELGYEIPTLPASHLPPYEYIRDAEIEGELVRIPPTSGNHLGQTSPYGFVGDALVVENVVHNMEHGAVVIWYQPDDEALETEISNLVSQLGRQCIVAGSYESMSFQVAATVWGRVFPQATYDKDELVAFIEKYRGNAGPPTEAGLCRRQ